MAAEDDHPDSGQLESREPTLEDLCKLCRELNRRQARYVVVGGFAMAALGYNRRTMDVDLLVDTDGDNESRVLEAVATLPDGAARESLRAQRRVRAPAQELWRQVEAIGPGDRAEVRVECAPRKVRLVEKTGEPRGDAFKLGPHVEAAAKAVSEGRFDHEIVSDTNVQDASLDAGHAVGRPNDLIVRGVHFATGMTSVPM